MKLVLPYFRMGKYLCRNVPLIPYFLANERARSLSSHFEKPLIFLLLFEHRGMDQPFPIPTNCPTTTFACRTTIHISENNVIKYPNTQFYINRICAQLARYVMYVAYRDKSLFDKNIFFSFFQVFSTQLNQTSFFFLRSIFIGKIQQIFFRQTWKNIC